MTVPDNLDKDCHAIGDDGWCDTHSSTWTDPEKDCDLKRAEIYEAVYDRIRQAMKEA